ncbi:MAG: EAL domain-containing protein [Deinococcus sp.]|uniref:putative bifunctional diguanylate cyclase/phosphodiesterase n=1 Tax=Deinococcus sp. TaxID=47478 RepID=UPI0026DC817F|nr:EAL domain-containing protein [Deinococcus sp.]MDO4246352.1 EAL domain-containing protein [Deinococcus sp.]
MLLELFEQALSTYREQAEQDLWLQQPVFVLAEDETVVHWNSACTKWLGHARAEVEGQPIQQVLSSALEGLRLQGVLAQAWQGEPLQSVTLSLCSRDKQTILGTFAIAPTHGPTMHLTFTLISGTAQQGTDRQAFYESLLSALPAPLAIFDPQKRYVFCNPAAISNPEIREWVIGKDDIEYTEYRGLPKSLAERRHSHFDLAVRERGTVQFEEQLTDPQGEAVYQLRTYTPVFDEQGELALCIGHGMNVTELRRTQNALHELNDDLEERVQARTRELEELSLQLQHDALHDSLTGLPNRALFSDRLSQAIARARQPGAGQYAVLFLDADRFKGINDTLGHPTGDALLIEMGQRLAGCLRSTDTVARLGGDEFTVLLEPLMYPEHATNVAQRIQEALRRPMQLGGQSVSISASIGIVLGSGDYDTAMAVLRDADIAMYRAKDAGRAGYQVFTAQMREHTLHINRMESELRRALAGQELRAMYQPVLNLQTGYISGFEALVRWQHPERGLLDAGEFVPIAQDIGLLPDIDRWMLRRACQELQAWTDRYPNEPQLSLNVNFCGQHLDDPQVCEFVRDVLETTGLDPARLNIEITEGTLLSHAGTVRQTIEDLRALGVGLHLDDFGTGYSSLSYLQLYPLDALKIDRSFVQGMLENQSSAELVRTIIAMAKNMNLRVVAEGIEQPGHLQALQALGCDRGQGYLFSHPLSIQEARALVVQGQHFLRESWGFGDES